MIFSTGPLEQEYEWSSAANLFPREDESPGVVLLLCLSFFPGLEGEKGHFLGRVAGDGVGGGPGVRPNKTIPGHPHSPVLLPLAGTEGLDSSCDWQTPSCK